MTHEGSPSNWLVVGDAKRLLPGVHAVTVGPDLVPVLAGRRLAYQARELRLRWTAGVWFTEPLNISDRARKVGDLLLSGERQVPDTFARRLATPIAH